MKYVVTAINALSGLREAISNPMDYMQAHEALDNMKRNNRRSRKGRKPWGYPRIEAYYSRLHFEPWTE